MLNIVVYCPENAANMGNIIRIAYIFQAELFLIRPYGWIGNMRYFKNDACHFKNQELIRATMGCIEKIKIHEYNSWEDFYRLIKDDPYNAILFFSKNNAQGLQQYLKNNPQLKNQNLFLVFGSETFGLTKLAEKINLSPRIMLEPVNVDKSHNLANAIAICLYAISIHFNIA
ncbi:TrmH family RNA methyltransferase [[Mycoplasma] cavipharyngis]|uniref:TrmH family RNA methyltransferase n=1 Tax=[Mycoplasma] cavipharyngis TaxID=92757 RepID=UPI00370388BB